MRMRHHSGVTLIELLIVIAIIAIFSAGSLAVMTAPAEENVLANADYEAEAGQALFFGRFTMDAHAATTATLIDRGVSLQHAGGSTVYFVDAKRKLRRATPAGNEPVSIDQEVPQGAALVANVETFNVNTSAPGVLALRVGVRQKQLFRNKLTQRDIAVNLGGAAQ